MDPTFPPASAAKISDYVPQGCYSDSSTYGRALAYRQDQLDTTILTTELCLGACLASGYPLAGTEYSGEYAYPQLLAYSLINDPTDVIVVLSLAMAPYPYRAPLVICHVLETRARFAVEVRLSTSMSVPICNQKMLAGLSCNHRQ